MARFDLDSLDVPLMQAGMGGIAGPELAAAVALAGGLGTVAGTARPFDRDVANARELGAERVAVNLLLPFLQLRDVEELRDVDVVTTFWGKPERLSRAFWIHQCGSVREALEAEAAGADAVILQGGDAGGHVRGTLPVRDFVWSARRKIKVPMVAAGGIARASDFAELLDAGAHAVCVGTAFVVADESRAHPVYKEACVRGSETLVTELFGQGWPRAAHRVLANAATTRWLDVDSPNGPDWLSEFHLSDGQGAPDPESAASARLLVPGPPTERTSSSEVPFRPFYAGLGVTHVHVVRPAAEIVRRLVTV